MNADLITFLSAWTGGAELPESDRQRVLDRFERDSSFRAECIAEVRMLGMLKAVQTPGPRWMDLHDVLGLGALVNQGCNEPDWSAGVLECVKQQKKKASSNRRLFAWRPLTAAALGLVLGGLSASMGYGLGLRSMGREVPMLTDGFESGPSPSVTGVPADTLRWSGDYCEVVGAQNGLSPRDGRRMVRLLRSDHEGRSTSRPSRQGDLMRLIDARPFLDGAKSNGARGRESVVSLSAMFNAASIAADERYDGMVTIYALSEDINLRDATEDTIKRDALAFSLGKFSLLDENPATWQQASAQLLLPPGTAFVLLKVSVRRIPAPGADMSSLPESVTFSGHYVDDVRAAILFRDSVGGNSSASPLK